MKILSNSLSNLKNPKHSKSLKSATWVFWGDDASYDYAQWHAARVSSSPYQDYFAIFRTRGFTANPRTPKS